MKPEDPITSAVAIRPAHAADLHHVCALTREFATSFHTEMNAFAPSFSRLLQNPNALLLLAVQSEMVIGYLLGFDHDTLFANGPIAWIEELMVLPEQRRHRIGTQLVHHFEQWARSRENKLIALATRRAAAFYTALGYEESATYFRKLL
jgi:GNAT superfamily N-acetyltransferase